jgi:hypothetical protein
MMIQGVNMQSDELMKFWRTQLIQLGSNMDGVPLDLQQA